MVVARLELKTKERGEDGGDPADELNITELKNEAEAVLELRLIN